MIEASHPNKFQAAMKGLAGHGNGRRTICPADYQDRHEP